MVEGAGDAGGGVVERIEQPVGHVAAGLVVVVDAGPGAEAAAGVVVQVEEEALVARLAVAGPGPVGAGEGGALVVAAGQRAAGQLVAVAAIPEPARPDAASRRDLMVAAAVIVRPAKARVAQEDAGVGRQVVIGWVEEDQRRIALDGGGLGARGAGDGRDAEGRPAKNDQTGQQLQADKGRSSHDRLLYGRAAVNNP
jgi:hypothetical protein